MRLSLFISLVAFASIAPSLAQSVPAQTASAPLVLRGGVEHADRLEPVAPQLQAGAIFNPQSIPQIQPNNDWYWVPSWYAGQKHADYETILQDYDFQSGRTVSPNRMITNRQDLSIGFQRDKNGQVWEFKRAPYQTNVEWDKYFQTILVRVRDPVQVTPNQVVIRLVQTSVMVDKSSQRIYKTEQQEQFNTYTPSAPGTVTVQTSIKSFRADGSPLVQETSTRQIVDRAPFQPVDFYNGKDMRILFRDYMITRGYSNLLPENLVAPAPVAPGT